MFESKKLQKTEGNDLVPQKMKCPCCGKRAFDISNLPNEEIAVTIKCPQCKQFVTIPCAKDYVFNEKNHSEAYANKC